MADASFRILINRLCFVYAWILGSNRKHRISDTNVYLYWTTTVVFLSCEQLCVLLYLLCCLDLTTVRAERFNLLEDFHVYVILQSSVIKTSQFTMSRLVFLDFIVMGQCIFDWRHYPLTQSTDRITQRLNVSRSPAQSISFHNLTKSSLYIKLHRK